METNFSCQTPTKLTSKSALDSTPRRSTPYDLISPKPVHSNVIDPEDLSSPTLSQSPLNFPSCTLSPFQRYNLKKDSYTPLFNLSIKTNKVFSERNDYDYSPLFEEDLPNLSNSTCADSPELKPSFLRRPKPSRSRFACLNLEALPSYKDSEENVLNETEPQQIVDAIAENITTNEVANVTEATETQAILPNIEENTQNNVQEEPALDTLEDHHLGESFEFLFKRTPILKIFILLITLSLVSGAVIGMLEDKYTYRSLFIMVYILLSGLLIEKSYRLYKAEAFALFNNANVFSVVDTLVLLTITIVADLRVSEMISSLRFGSSACMALLFVYVLFARGTLKQKVIGTVQRAYLFAQFLLITQKIENNSDLSWKLVLGAGFVILGFYLCKLLKGIGQVLLAFNNQHSILSMIGKSSKVVSVFGLFLLAADIVVVMVILFGLAEVLDWDSVENMAFLKNWLTICQYLNASLLFFSTVAGSDLLEFVITAAEYFSPSQGQDEAKPVRKTVEEEKRIFVKKVSLTYYKVLAEKEIPCTGKKCEEKGQGEDKKETGEENTCYICCEKEANGMIVDCGHGGICFGCLKDYVSQKDDCMECRGKIETILKLEEKRVDEDIFTGNVICRIVRTQKV